MVMVDRWQREDEHRLASAAAALLVEDAPQIRNGAATANGRRASKGSGAYQQRLVEAEGDPADRKPSVEYDPIRAAARFAAQPMAVLRRQMELIGPLLGFLSRVILDKRAGKEAEHRAARAEELTELISSLGPAIIKAGQALSSRSDLLPLEYLQSLEQLQDRVPPFPTATAYSIIQAELGAPLESTFASIGPEPVAAASLGQVYQAVLATDGTRVAVKVQRPNVEAIIALDLYILRSYSLTLRSLLQLLGRNIDFVSVIDDFGRLIYAEVDYEVEAANARRFDRLYGALPNVSSPRIYDKFSTRRVLTMGWVDGVRLTDREALLARGLDPAALVDTLVQCSLRQMLEHGFFHADPHAGNLLVTDAGELVYLDFGMMSYLAPTQRYSLIEAVVHMVNRDFGALAELYRNLGFIPPEEDIGPIVTALNAALPDVLNAPVSELNFKSVVERLGDVMYKFPFSLPPFYIAILRCLGVLEGLALQVDDKSAIIHDAYPYIAARLLTDRSPQLRRALVTLIFRDGAIQWHLLEGLLDNAAGTRELDLLAAAEQLSDYLLSPEGSPMLERLTDEIVDEIDTLGAESGAYLYQTFGSFAAQLVAEALCTRRQP
ncbi:ABC-1 domain-containing protein [Chrysochromulina tobinii]|uniref:ABC-1 domain-containing protein n=1 Tax=Chrysochromulina tobinii TaxID=1460289 RepID=A0A0M0JRU6_9EUKA|nr:ABC-1 domain-containing protein [Chrysochromulina tobinii]|eukprot:KOO29007.1 ABC-1 domain-containing protein [Chrysochromulina sp. CCMP291]